MSVESGSEAERLLRALRQDWWDEVHGEALWLNERIDEKRAEEEMYRRIMADPEKRYLFKKYNLIY